MRIALQNQFLDRADRAIRFQVEAAARRLRLCQADAEDLCQNLWLHIWRTRHSFNPELGAASTFCERVVRNRLASLLRERRPHLVPLNDALELNYRDVPVDDEVQKRLDHTRVLAALSPEQRRIATALRLFPPIQASRRLKMARSTLYLKIAELRVIYEAAGLAPGRRRRAA